MENWEDIDAQLEKDVSAAALNKPGLWDFFISHTQRNDAAVALAEKLYASLKERGKKVWLDVNMKRRDEAAMEEGVRNSGCVIAVITDGDGVPGNAYFERPFCLKELRWGMESRKYIQPVIRDADKQRVGEFMGGAPDDLKFLGSVDFIDMNRGAIQYWNVGVDMIVERADNPPELNYKVPSKSPPAAPAPSSSTVGDVDSEVMEFMRDLKLDKYVPALVEQGVSTFDDLKSVDEDIMDDCGFTPIHKKAFLRKRPTSAMPRPSRNPQQH
eukprot:CAMPEP_0118935886 /NCGR_PEP_ID=MMETSP1169-20130426/15885_1 /TAXON_ID=36882 /ORGANISM="Pyramimonas obovata, Strain CCMP722" /LENGTH=269 /DNA_ID=CAMNT_0006878961 /DNA_START=142 /DNA_END=954 /DNA_ORIENTATION=+